MPQRVTMLRAISVVRLMSFDAPVVTACAPNTSSSAMRPP